MSVKIKQVEPQVAQKLGDPLRNILHELRYSIPEHYELQVALLDASGRKKRSDASADNWSPESGRIEIRFQPAALQPKPAPSNAARHQGAPVVQTHTHQDSENAPGAAAYVQPAECDLLRALDRAESTKGWSFVPLKKFRDEILPSEHFPSMRSEVEHQAVLRSVIEKRLVLVGKVPNPKAPQFPVTTIRLNRLMPEVRAALGQASDPSLEFRPIEIRGEPLSATILRERR